MSKKKRILLIEDEQALAHALGLKLGKAGFEVTHMSNGEDGLEEILKGGYAIALLDLVMPKMDGFEVLENLKKKKKKTPVIVLSNLSQVEDETRAKSLGAKAFFIKSNTPISDIVKKVDELV